MIRIRSLGLLLTYKCNAKCQHCAYACGPKFKGKMEVKDAENYIEQVKDDLEVVCISGGEPSIYYDTLVKVVESATRVGISSIWVFTNGFWAQTDDVVREKLVPLKKKGVTKMIFSVDAYHQEFVPLEFVERAIQITMELGIDTEVDARFLGLPSAKNSQNLTTKRLLQQLHPLKVEIYESQPWYVGRAAELLSHYVERKFGLPLEKCDKIWSLGDLMKPEGVDIDQYGNVMVCPGISVGNANKKAFSDIVRCYDYRENPIIRAIAEGGPTELVEKAKGKGYFPREGYINKCHLCYDVRKFLRPYYPEILTPRNCYTT